MTSASVPPTSSAAPRPAPLPLAPRVTEVRVDPPFALVATFEAGGRRRPDLADGVDSGPIAPPAAPAALARAAVERGGFGLAWPGGAGLHRGSLYYGGEPA